MRILLVSGYHGGSHRAWANGYRQHSSHTVELLTLPARFWKWRMHGGAVTLARRFLENVSTGRSPLPDLLLFTDMIDVSTFLALVRHDCPALPVALYMHENQLTYPLPDTRDSGPMRRQKGERDLHYAFINYSSMLVSDRVYFNSQYHRDELLGALPKFLRHFPEFNELDTLPSLATKSTILPVGIDGDYLSMHAREETGYDVPLIMWNQRWEFDKNPEQFFDALARLVQLGIAFKLSVCGEQFSRAPLVFETAKSALRDRIVHWGYADRELYRKLLWQSSITASTALHEFFGISILEAMFCQTYAVLPRSLSYPELLPEELHGACLYDDADEFEDKLRWALLNRESAEAVGKRLAKVAAAYDWRVIAPGYDAEFEGLA